MFRSDRSKIEASARVALTGLILGSLLGCAHWPGIPDAIDTNGRSRSQPFPTITVECRTPVQPGFGAREECLQRECRVGPSNLWYFDLPSISTRLIRYEGEEPNCYLEVHHLHPARPHSAITAPTQICLMVAVKSDVLPNRSGYARCVADGTWYEQLLGRN